MPKAQPSIARPRIMLGVLLCTKFVAFCPIKYGDHLIRNPNNYQKLIYSLLIDLFAKK